MTRINCIPPEELSGPHLVAEYRELPRVFALARAAIERGERPDDPKNPKAYTLGPGHVRFFYSRLGYLAKRQASLILEMQRRGYRPTFRNAASLLAGLPATWCNDWEPTDLAVETNKERIRERTGRKGAPRGNDESEPDCGAVSAEPSANSRA
jgi:deoxyribonuclease (pyrimidine dimer)